MAYRRREAVRIEGIEETLSVLRAAPDVVERRVLTFAVRRAAVLMRRELKRAAPTGETTVLKRSIRMKRVRTRERRGRVRFFVGTTGRGFYARFLEYGWKHNRTGRLVKPARTIGWMGKAFKQADSAALNLIFEEVQRRLPVEIERYAQRRGALRRRRR